MQPKLYNVFEDKSKDCKTLIKYKFMKKFFYGIIATVFISFCSFATTKINNNYFTRLSTNDVNYEAVSKLITESLKVWSKDPYTSFFNSEIISLSEKITMTAEATERFKTLYNEGCQRMLLQNSVLSEAYNAVVALGLSETEFKSNVDRFSLEHPLNTLAYNKALIPNKKACAVATAAVGLCNQGFSQYCWGYVGYWVHC